MSRGRELAGLRERYSLTTIGLDIAKSAFQVHGVDAEGNVILRRQLKRHRKNTAEFAAAFGWQG